MASVVLPLAVAILAGVLERLVLFKDVIADGVVVAVVSVCVIVDVVVVAVGLTVVLSFASPDVGVSD